MKKNLSLYMLNTIVLFVWAFVVPDNNIDIAANNYIDQYSELAIIEMYRTGIPASITMAQGLHESHFGQSRLALEANNHFGIKCKSYWNGSTFYHKDDDKNKAGILIESCFRAYETAIDSYIDHSNFLKHTDHYKSLFSFSKEDYIAWANGLQKAGYATDPNYATKLINFIEKFDLDRFDYVKNPYEVMLQKKRLTTNN